MTYSAKDKPSRGNVPEHAEMLTSAYKFGKLMMEGKIRAALRLIADDNNSGPLCLDSMVESGESVNPETVREALKKYPPGQTRKKSAIFSPSTPVTQSHPVLFDRTDAQASGCCSHSFTQFCRCGFEGHTKALPGSCI